MLSGERFWEQTAFCLWSLGQGSSRPVHPVIYDDGTLRPELQARLNRAFEFACFVSPADTLARLDEHLPVTRFPTLRERWHHYPNIRKLIDPHLGSSGWKLVLDSDLLFFRRPQLLIDWQAAPHGLLHAIDCEESYGYTRRLMEDLAGAPIPRCVNVGICGLASESLDWDILEHWCRELITRERTHYYLEQALVAMLASRQFCTVLPATDYVTKPLPPEASDCKAVMHHYVAESKRWYFRENWRRFAPR